ncbi:amidase family protein [Enterococcus sp. 3G6_DIV0642]|uniref:amidase family protein n=1 Tax=Enterococcus sp. 3G6_DIV0642 TaxID=1834177 RepID=UPI000A3550BA|nr:amidase family protein [Enterococcus sp. 3G6_DIV0642]OTO17016.1 hypothetical protein A5878_001592 [Enterococcus sp. 3G6_DIV0642]
MEQNKVQEYSKRTSLAMANFYNSVIKVFPNCIEKISSSSGYYIGLKDSIVFTSFFIDFLEKNGFHLHTIDKASHKGRGIDIDLRNPITGGVMTGSSSGTAVNVFLGINDVGIGTDGGGSVLAPAAALNLVGYIHPEVGKKMLSLEKMVKSSTDGISFTPSIGLISREIDLIKQLAQILTDHKDQEKTVTVAVDSEINKNLLSVDMETMKIITKDFSYKYQESRKKLIDEVERLFLDVDIIISKEGPIDIYGIGETLIGHFDDQTRENQVAGKKGFIRVVNMCNAIGLIVPTTSLATGYLIIGKPQSGIEQQMFHLAKKLIAKEDRLLKNYFLDHHSYFDDGYNL